MLVLHKTCHDIHNSRPTLSGEDEGSTISTVLFIVKNTDNLHNNIHITMDVVLLQL
jgi:hypothetical protein